jgi:hypothetical protein
MTTTGFPHTTRVVDFLVNGQRGQKPFFPPNIGMEYRMKIEQNGGKLQKLGDT